MNVAGFRAEVDSTDETLGKKIRNAKLERVFYRLVIGDKEMESGNFILEDRGDKKEESLSADKIISLLSKKISSRI